MLDLVREDWKYAMGHHLGIGRIGILLLLAAIVLLSATGIWLALQHRSSRVPSDPAAQAAALHDAVRRDDVDAVRVLLDAGVDPNAPEDEFGATPLHRAAANDLNDIAAVLIEAGADPDRLLPASGETPLTWAIQNGNTATAVVIVAAGCDVEARNARQYTPLHIASFRRSPSVVRILLEYGADPNVLGPSRATPLIAMGYTHPEVVRALLDAGADPNAANEINATALHYAASMLGGLIDSESSYDEATIELRESLDLLIDAGADVNATDETGRTPIFYGIQEGSRHIIDYLLARGADLHHRTNEGYTLLHEVAASGLTILGMDRRSLAAYLIRLGIPVDATSDGGLTALHLAARAGHADICQYLCDLGLNPAQPDAEGRTPIDDAREAGFEEVVDLLEQHAEVREP